MRAFLGLGVWRWVVLNVILFKMRIGWNFSDKPWGSYALVNLQGSGSSYSHDGNVVRYLNIFLWGTKIIFERQHLVAASRDYDLIFWLIQNQWKPLVLDWLTKKSLFDRFLSQSEKSGKTPKLWFLVKSPFVNLYTPSPIDVIT